MLYTGAFAPIWLAMIYFPGTNTASFLLLVVGLYVAGYGERYELTVKGWRPPLDDPQSLERFAGDPRANPVVDRAEMEQAEWFLNGLHIAGNARTDYLPTPYSHAEVVAAMARYGRVCRGVRKPGYLMERDGQK